MMKAKRGKKEKRSISGKCTKKMAMWRKIKTEWSGKGFLE